MEATYKNMLDDVIDRQIRLVSDHRRDKNYAKKFIITYLNDMLSLGMIEENEFVAYDSIIQNKLLNL